MSEAKVRLVRLTKQLRDLTKQADTILAKQESDRLEAEKKAKQGQSPSPSGSGR